MGSLRYRRHCVVHRRTNERCNRPASSIINGLPTKQNRKLIDANFILQHPKSDKRARHSEGPLLTQIDFYILPDDTVVEPLRYTCRLIEKVYRLGHGIYVHCADQIQCQQIDDMLWQMDEASFIPHSHLAAGGPAENNPILIGCHTPPENHGEVLVNLAGDTPNFFSRFRRVAEIVPGRTEERTKSRQNYLFYKERGYPLNTHNIKPTNR